MTPFVLIVFIVASNAMGAYKVKDVEHDDPTLFETKAACEQVLLKETPGWKMREDELGPIELVCTPYEGIVKDTFPMHPKDLKNNTESTK